MSYWKDPDDEVWETTFGGHFYGERGFCIYCGMFRWNKLAFLGCGHRAWMVPTTREWILQARAPIAYAQLPAMKVNALVRILRTFAKEMGVDDDAVPVLSAGGDDG